MERVEIENSEHVPFYVWFDIDEDHAEDEKVERKVLKRLIMARKEKTCCMITLS